MKWLHELIGKKQFRQLEVDQLVDLSLIRQPDVNLVYFKRPVDTDIEIFARLLIQQSFLGIHAVVTSETLDGVVTDHVNAFGLYTSGKVKFTQDVIKIAQSFFTVTETDQARLILKVVADDACRKFHTDAYDLRLLCTYVGTGTEWIEDQYVNRKKLISGSNTEIIKDRSRIQVMQPFEVAILKGEISSRPQCKGIVHRSPSIQLLNAKRLLLRLDFNS
jgi:hypothetical protein